MKILGKKIEKFLSKNMDVNIKSKIKEISFNRQRTVSRT